MSKPIKHVFINGMNDPTHGQNNINRLIPFLKKYRPNDFYDTDSATYGRIGLFVSNYLWRFTWVVKIIPRIASALVDADYCYLHSNGANFCMQALKRICNPKLKIIMLSGALDIDYKFKQEFKTLDCYHSRNDDTVKKARLLPWSDWGSGGAYGFNSSDPRVNNIDYTKLIDGHSDWFKDGNIQIIAERISEIYAEEQLNNMHGI